MLDKLSALPAQLGEAETLLADSGYFSQANVEACAAAGIEPLIPQGRQTHYPPLSERFANVPPAPEHPTPLATMAHPHQGSFRWLIYARPGTVAGRQGSR
jgi:hypothetical protein